MLSSADRATAAVMEVGKRDLVACFTEFGGHKGVSVLSAVSALSAVRRTAAVPCCRLIPARAGDVTHAASALCFVPGRWCPQATLMPKTYTSRSQLCCLHLRSMYVPHPGCARLCGRSAVNGPRTCQRLAHITVALHRRPALVFHSC